MAKNKITANDICMLLNKKYPNLEQSMIAFEVGDGTGSNQRRWADAISMEFWPSKGLQIVGYEIKVSRSDWLSELKQPDKSAAVSRYCDKFYLVAPKGVLGIDELPKTWGYMEVGETGFNDALSIRTKMKAPQREVTPINRVFAASLIRSALRKYSDKKLVTAMLEEQQLVVERQAEYRYKSQMEAQKLRYVTLFEKVRDFQNKTGVSISNWSYSRTAEALKFMVDTRNRKNAIDELKQQLQQHKFMLDNEQKMLDAIEGWPEEIPATPEPKTETVEKG